MSMDCMIYYCFLRSVMEPSHTLEEAEGYLSDGDVVKAREICEELAEEGSPEAMYILGIIYRDGGRGIVSDIDESRRWFSRSYKAGYGKARDALLALNTRSEYITIFSPNGYEGNFGGEMSRYRR